MMHANSLAGLDIRKLSNRLVIAQSIDVVTFLVFYLFLSTGSIHAERNPLVLFLMALGGVQMVGLTKVGIALLVRHRSIRNTKVLSKKYQALRFTMLTLATASGIVGAGFNLASIIDTLV